MVGHNHGTWRRSTLGRELPAYRGRTKGLTPCMRSRDGGCLRLVAGRPDGLWQWAVYPAGGTLDEDTARSEAWGVEESRELAMIAAAQHVPLGGSPPPRTGVRPPKAGPAS